MVSYGNPPNNVKDTESDGGTDASLTTEESMLIAKFRAGDLAKLTLFILDNMPGGTPKQPAEQLPPTEDAFYRVSIGVLAMLMHDWIEPEELADRFQPIDLLANIEHAIRQEMLAGAVEYENLRRLMRLQSPRITE